MFAERENSAAAKGTYFIYEWKDEAKKSRNTDIFTAKNVQTMCKVEHALLSHTGKVQAPRSPMDAGPPKSYIGDSADFTDFCALSYTTADPTENATKCQGQSLTPAGAIYSALKGAYSKDCVELDDAEVKTAALCLYYFHFIGDKAKMEEAAKVI